MIYALLDGERLIASRHLDAAAAVWRYALDSAAYVFGETQFTPLAQKFNAALETAGSAGLTRTELRELAGSNAIKGATIAKALEELNIAGLARVDRNRTDGKSRGRAPEIWRHITHALLAASSARVSSPPAAQPERGIGEIGEIGENGIEGAAGSAIPSHSSRFSYSSFAPTGDIAAAVARGTGEAEG